MPTLRIQSNAPVANDTWDALITAALAKVAKILGKPERGDCGTHTPNVVRRRPGTADLYGAQETRPAGGGAPAFQQASQQ